MLTLSLAVMCAGLVRAPRSNWMNMSDAYSGNKLWDSGDWSEAMHEGEMEGASRCGTHLR